MQNLCNNAQSSCQHDSNISTTMDDNFADYRRFYANRMRRLERYKKAKSFCSLEDETSNAEIQAQAQAQTSISNDDGCPSSSTTAGSTALCEQRLTVDSSPRTITNSLAQRVDDTNGATLINSQSDHDSSNATQKFDLLREKMISLMENDVRLLQQLLALGDSIQELKSKNQHGSQMSLNSLEEEEEDDGDDERENDKWHANKANRFSASLSAVTNLYVDDEPKENVQYFSRKNSVLRIPIPPRSSNRMCANKRIPRRLSELTRPPRTLHIEESHHHADPSYSEPNSAMQSPATYGTTVARLSNGSIDSGIRDGSPSSPSSGSPSPTFIQAKLE
uniref:Uncharacterized protein n=1 Tax=Parascaris univalens TaxID=6257 RepID=A0A915BW00_PARUN